MTKRIGSSGRIKPRAPSRLAATKVVRSQGPSAKSLVDRQTYWAVQNETTRQNAEYDRQEDESLVGHFDLQPTPSVEPTDPATTSLDDSQPQITGGSTLTAAGQLPANFIPPPA